MQRATGAGARGKNVVGYPKCGRGATAGSGRIMISVPCATARRVHVCLDCDGHGHTLSLSAKGKSSMKRHRRLPALSLLVVVACLAPPAHAFDRTRAGQWHGTTTAGGRTFQTSSCLTQRDADALNGDAKAVRTYLETIIPPTLCKLTNVKAEGNQIVYTAACGSTAPNVVTTSYHGNSFESTDSVGSKTEAKWVGPCK
jgi:hypothetical protein